MTAVAEQVPTTLEPARPRLSPRAEGVTVAVGTWLMLGLFVDGWAHGNLEQLETFFTPWHAAFYSGFIATASWIAWQALRRPGRGLARVPLGYGLGLVGVVIFGIGGVGDLLWHSIFGIEQDVEALFSPTHLLLFVGMLLILSSPLRAAWAADPLDAAPRYSRFLPTLASVTLSTVLVAFMWQFQSAFLDGDPFGPFARGYYELISPVASVMATTLILLAPLVLMARRWVLPFGTATTLFAVPAVLVSALGQFWAPGLMAAGIVAGLLTDVLIRVLRVRPGANARLWLLGLLAPLVLWSLWFAAGAATLGGVWFSVEVWSGTILWAGLMGGLLAVLMSPPRPGLAAGAPEV